MPRCFVMGHAVNLYNYLANQNYRWSSNIPKFKASLKWYRNFLRRFHLRAGRLSGEKANADFGAAANFCPQIESAMESNYSQSLVFNLDETNFEYKILSRDSVRQIGVQCSKAKLPHTRCTLVLGSNVNGTCKLKPVLLHVNRQLPSQETVSIGEEMGVNFVRNSSGFMTCETLREYLLGQFSTEVRAFCRDNSLPFRVLLLIDSAPSHSLSRKPICT